MRGGKLTRSETLVRERLEADSRRDAGARDVKPTHQAKCDQLQRSISAYEKGQQCEQALTLMREMPRSEWKPGGDMAPSAVAILAQVARDQLQHSGQRL